MATNEKREWAIKLLISKSDELKRLPKKDDFDEKKRSQIKAFLGPWPRALEAAGLKEVKVVSNKPKRRKRKQKNSNKQAFDLYEKGNGDTVTELKTDFGGNKL